MGKYCRFIGHDAVMVSLQTCISVLSRAQNTLVAGRMVLT